MELSKMWDAFHLHIHANPALWVHLPFLELTATFTPENWLGDDHPYLLGYFGLFTAVFAVRLRKDNHKEHKDMCVCVCLFVFFSVLPGSSFCSKPIKSWKPTTKIGVSFMQFALWRSDIRKRHWRGVFAGEISEAGIESVGRRGVGLPSLKLTGRPWKEAISSQKESHVSLGWCRDYGLSWIVQKFRSKLTSQNLGHAYAVGKEFLFVHVRNYMSILTCRA